MISTLISNGYKMSRLLIFLNIVIYSLDSYLCYLVRPLESLIQPHPVALDLLDVAKQNITMQGAALNVLLTTSGDEYA